MCPEDTYQKSKKYLEYEVFNMKKRIAARLIIGFPIGIAIGNIITVIISLFWGGGSYIICTDEFIGFVGNEAAAAAVQTLLCGIMGVGFAAASFIWEADSISLLKQTVSCFLIYLTIMFPVAYFANWMQHSFIGVIIYIGIFASIFAIIWLIQFLVWKKKIKSINAVLKNR